MLQTVVNGTLDSLACIMLSMSEVIEQQTVAGSQASHLRDTLSSSNSGVHGAELSRDWVAAWWWVNVVSCCASLALNNRIWYA
jgi:hypothetical protein